MDVKTIDAVQHNPPDVVTKSTEYRAGRRKCSIAEKQRILNAAAACKHDELGMLLRKEGIYSATLASWRKQQGKSTAGKRSRKSVHKPSTKELVRENQRLLEQLNQAKAIIDIQEKLRSGLGLTPAEEAP